MGPGVPYQQVTGGIHIERAVLAIDKSRNKEKNDMIFKVKLLISIQNIHMNPKYR